MSGINMRREFVRWLKAHGHWAVLRAAVPGKRCPCTANESDQPISSCRRCFGTGFGYADHLVKVGRRAYSPDFVVGLAAGEAAMGRVVYYLDRHQPAKRDDFLLELELDNTTLEPLAPWRIREAYRVTEVRDMRDRGGRVEYFQVLADHVDVR